MLRTEKRSPSIGQAYRSMATMLAAGLSPVDAVMTLQVGDEPRPKSWAPVLERLNRGQIFAAALAAGGWHSPCEIEFMSAAEAAGKLPAALLFLADACDARHARINRLKSQLWLPVFVLLVGLVAAVWLSAARYPQGLMGEIASTVLSLFLVYVATRALLAVLSQDALQWLSWLWRADLVRRLSLAQLVFEYYWYSLLMWKLDAGVDHQTAIRQSSALLDSRKYRACVQSCQALLGKGVELAAALSQSGLLMSAEMKQVTRVAEHAGSLSGALCRHLDIQRGRVDLMLDVVFEWLPRGYYLLVLLVVLHHFS